MGRPRKVEAEPAFDTSHEYKCLCCGQSYESPVGHFFRSQWSKVYAQNSQYVPICKKCVDELFADLERRHGTRTACMIMCHYMDVPYSHEVFNNLKEKDSAFAIGMYMRIIQMKQYQKQDFGQTILTKELSRSDEEIRKVQEDRWTAEEKRNQRDVLSIVGYDPFDGYPSDARKFLYSEVIKYFDDDVGDDPYKLSQILQIVINNNQIRQYDIQLSRLNPAIDSEDIKNIMTAKTSIVAANDKIAKENEISVRNRSNREVGRSTLGYLMRKMREANIPNAEQNYYDQLRSIGTQWAADMSMKAIKQNTFFNENDTEAIFVEQRSLIESLLAKVDDLTEENRVLKLAQKAGEEE